jgi:hypothetical protein
VSGTIWPAPSMTLRRAGWTLLSTRRRFADPVVLGSAVYFGRWLDEAHGVIDAKIAVGLVRTRDGDCRDWPAVRAWADHIAVDLTLTGRSAIVRGDQR